jgi:acetyltransferase EpsM
MNKELIIIGDGYQAKLLESLILAVEIKLLGFFILNKKNVLKKKKYKFFYNFKDIKKIKNKNLYFICAIGDNLIRNKVVEKFEKNIKKIRWYSYISEKALIIKSSKIACGTTIMPRVIINGNSRIGKHCIINTRSLIEHDNNFKNFSSTGPGVITGGNVKVGNKSFLGMASVIKNNIKIGNNTIIGAKSLVIKDCKSNSKYYGTPSKKID